MPLVHGWGIDSGRPSQMDLEQVHIWFFIWAYTFLYIFLNYSVLLWLPRVLKCVYTPGSFVLSSPSKEKKNVQEGSNVRGKEHRLHALESDTVALCCLIAMKITLHNNKNLYLGWLIHQPLWLKWQLWIHFGSWIVTVGNLAFRVLVYCCLFICSSVYRANIFLVYLPR